MVDTSYPLRSLSLAEAMERQFRLVDLIHSYFKGEELLSGGDLGVVPSLGRPHYTARVEQILASFFDAEAAVLVRGAGTGAIRYALEVMAKPGNFVLLHQAPIYPTTETTIQSMGLIPCFADFNQTDRLVEQLLKLDKQHDLQAAIVQHTRQTLYDRYDLEETIRTIKKVKPIIRVLVDDNYAVMKTAGIGVQFGADLSAFSMFKLLGPEGVGCIVGDGGLIERIRKRIVSGGGQVQGHEAMNALRALVYVPVAFAIQSEQVDQVVLALKNQPVEHIKNAFVANAQSKVIIVEFDEPIAPKVLRHAWEMGAAPYPVGAESKYEVTALFYRISRTFLQDVGQERANYFIRINPMRAGAGTVLRILKEAVRKATTSE